MIKASVAQLIERSFCKRMVAGLNPASGLLWRGVIKYMVYFIISASLHLFTTGGGK